MNIFIAEPNEINSQAIDLLKINKHRVFIKSFKKNIIEVIFLRTYISANKQYLSGFPNLKYILKAGVGLDNIDLNYCKTKNITIFNAPASNSNAVAEFVLSTMIMLLKKTSQQINELKEGHWRNKLFQGEELKNKIVGIVGCGAIGKLLAKKLSGCDVKKIIGYDPYLDKNTLKQFNIIKSSLDYLICNSDIITLHLPLTKDTKDLISKIEFKMMKKNAYIINTSRGGIVNEKDLVFALKKNIISGAALDVFEDEPNILKDLTKLPNIILTPHIAAYTYEADKQMSIIPVQRFLEFTDS